MIDRYIAGRIVERRFKIDDIDAQIAQLVNERIVLSKANVQDRQAAGGSATDTDRIAYIKRGYMKRVVAGSQSVIEFVDALLRVCGAGHLPYVGQTVEPKPVLDERPAPQLHSNVGPSEGQETDREPN